MKQLNVANNGMIEMDREELKNVVGGGDIMGYAKCVAATLTSGGGGVRTLLLGTTVFGMARVLGVMVGCL
jgi:hypothetical protein